MSVLRCSCPCQPTPLHAVWSRSPWNSVKCNLPFASPGVNQGLRGWWSGKCSIGKCDLKKTSRRFEGTTTTSNRNIYLSQKKLLLDQFKMTKSGSNNNFDKLISWVSSSLSLFIFSKCLWIQPSILLLALQRLNLFIKKHKKVIVSWVLSHLLKTALNFLITSVFHFIQALQLFRYRFYRPVGPRRGRLARLKLALGMMEIQSFCSGSRLDFLSHLSLGNATKKKSTSGKGTLFTNHQFLGSGGI